MAKIIAYPSVDLFFTQVFFQINVGFYKDDNTLELLSPNDITYEVLYNGDNLNVDVGILLSFMPLDIGTYVIRFKYFDVGLNQYFHYDLNFYAFGSTINLNAQTIYDIIISEMPPLVYNDDIDDNIAIYIDNIATATVIADFYSNAYKYLELVDPGFSYNAQWEIMVNGTTNLFSSQVKLVGNSWLLGTTGDSELGETTILG